MKKTIQSGRSLLEVIAVISIMGIFTVASVVVFQAAMNSVRSKYIVEQVMVRANEVIESAWLKDKEKGTHRHGKMVYTPEYSDKTRKEDGAYGYTFRKPEFVKGSSLLLIVDKSAGKLTKVNVTVDGVITPGVCNSLKEKVNMYTEIIEVNDAYGFDRKKNPCPKEDLESLTFLVDLSKRASSNVK